MGALKSSLRQEGKQKQNSIIRLALRLSYARRHWKYVQYVFNICHVMTQTDISHGQRIKMLRRSTKKLNRAKT